MVFGADNLVATLKAGGIEVCFANPGTSEIHVVSAFDRQPGIRCALTLFEGVATGAADGYGRMTDRPAATLLHLGPGLANGLANLHNARKAESPVVNIVGDHATYHLQHDAPLTADVEGVARPMSHWVRTAPDAASLAGLAAEAIAAARTPPGRIATLIVPADAAWNETPAEIAHPIHPPHPAAVAGEAVRAAAEALRTGQRVAFFLDGPALREDALAWVGRIAAATGARLIAKTLCARVDRGAGRVTAEKLPYPVAQAIEALSTVDHLILVGTKAPVGFFAYPDKPSVLTPAHCRIHTLAAPGEDALQALAWLAEEMGAHAQPVPVQELALPTPATGAVTPKAIGRSVAALLPDHAVVVDESITAGGFLYPPTDGARPHSWTHVTGGSIGYGPPVALGAATACPDRRVVNLQADGSAMYTLQALWSQAREGANVTTVILNNRSYAILRVELGNLGFQDPGAAARAMTDLTGPALDWVSLAKGMGVPAARADDMETFNDLLARSLATPGPFLIEAMMAG